MYWINALKSRITLR